MPSPEMMFPIILLLIDNDDDRQRVVELYHAYKGLFYKVAIHYFGHDYCEVEDAISSTVEQICRYYEHVRKVPEYKLPAYMRKIVESVCMRRMTKLQRQRQNTISFDDAYCQDIHSSNEDMFTSVFDRTNAQDLLNSYDQLSERDRKLIWMRHIDHMEYREIAEALNTTEGALRAAVHRAKQKLRIAAEAKRGDA